MGGLTDLFIGLSFFTAYQFIEWLINKTIRKLLVNRRTVDISEDVQIEDTNVWWYLLINLIYRLRRRISVDQNLVKCTESQLHQISPCKLETHPAFRFAGKLGLQGAKPSWSSSCSPSDSPKPCDSVILISTTLLFPDLLMCWKSPIFGRTELTSMSGCLPPPGSPHAWDLSYDSHM